MALNYLFSKIIQKLEKKIRWFNISGKSITYYYNKETSELTNFVLFLKFKLNCGYCPLRRRCVVYVSVIRYECC